MPDLLHLTVDQWIAFWAGVVTLLLGLAALVGTATAVALTFQANARERDRDEQQDRDRVDRWLAEFLVACAEYVNDLEMAPFSRMSGQRIYVSPQRVRATLEAARLVARGATEESLGLVAARLRVVLDEGAATQETAIARLAAEVRDWRNGSSTAAQLEAFLKDQARSADQADTPT